MYTHRWRLYDIVMWDNRVTMHRARRHSPETDPRDMRRVSVLDMAHAEAEVENAPHTPQTVSAEEH